MRRGQITVFIILGLVFVILVALTLYIVERQQKIEVTKRTVERVPIALQDCADGTKEGQCSFDRPAKCVSGVLKQYCSDCGCPTNLLCNANGTCAGRVEDVQSNFTIYVVPIGYDPSDREFMLRTEILKTTLFAQFPLKDSSFVVVESTMPESDCDTITGNFNKHVQEWLQQRTGHGLPGVRFDGAIPIYTYRIIGISGLRQDVSKCGCAYSITYGTNVYVGGDSCSLVPHVTLHELGHTIGLCDEYDTCTYDKTNEWMEQAFHHRCLNDRPTALNGDCGVSCCKTDGTACCNGVYADTKVDGFFNIMGSADIPPPRRLDTRTKGFYKAYFCALGVCG